MPNICLIRHHLNESTILSRESGAQTTFIDRPFPEMASWGLITSLTRSFSSAITSFILRDAIPLLLIARTLAVVVLRRHSLYVRAYSYLASLERTSPSRPSLFFEYSPARPLVFNAALSSIVPAESRFLFFYLPPLEIIGYKKQQRHLCRR